MIEQVENNSEFIFFYLNDTFDKNRKVSVEVENQPVESVLDQLFAGTNNTYKVSDRQITISKKEHIVGTLLPIPDRLQTSNKEITGVVKDVSGLPLIGANVQVKGTSIGAVTDFDGQFLLNVPEKGTLVVSYIGFVTQEVPIGIANTYNIVLQEDAFSLEEMVVIGYGTTRKADLSTAISTVKVDQKMKSRPSQLSSLLQGQLPGLSVQVSGGDPLHGASWNIRGKGSRDGDGILWVVDGVPGGSYIVEDIESVTVLKDAASAAIYGASVGSGGVIFITTKKAKAGKLKVDVNVSNSFKNNWRLPETLTAEEYGQVWRDATESSLIKRDVPFVADFDRYPYGKTTRTDWLDEVFRTGHVQHYAISLSGGSDNIKALGSFSYDKNKGIMLNTYSESFKARMNLDFQVTKWLKLSQNFQFGYSNGQGDIWNGSHEGILMRSIFYPRAATVYEYNQDGTPVLDDYGNQIFGGTIPRWAVDQGASGYGEIANPVAELARLRQHRPSASIHSTTSLEIKPISELTFRSDFTPKYSLSRYESFYMKVPEYGRPDMENYRTVNNTWNTSWIWENTASYAQVFDKHHVSALAGFTLQRYNWRWNGSTTYDFDRETPNYTILGNGNDWNKSRPGESISDESMTSYYGRIGYSYDDRYFMTASIRRDATSKLAPENNSGIFPAFSASWKLSSESFFNVDAISLLKIRGSWGQVGSVSLVPNYSYIASLSKTAWPAAMGKDLNQQLFGTYISTLINRDLTWETTEQIGGGLDVGLFNNSLNITVDYFHKTTKDLIDYMPIPSTAGIANEPRGNIGKVLNTGWEASVNYTKRVGEVSFNLYGNIGAVKSEVQDLGSREEMEHGTTINALKPLRSKVGEPWYSFALIETDGLFMTQTEIDNYVGKDGSKIQPNAKPGDLKYVDYNGDGMINDQDRQYMGSFLPELTYGFGGGFEYKGFDFSFLLQGLAGAKIFNGFKMMGLTGRQQGNNMLADIKKSWTYDKSSDIPRLTLVDDANGNYSTASDFFLEKGDYLRLKNVTIGYSLPKSLMRQMGMDNSILRIYVGAENLFTFTDYSGFDPEVGNYGIDAGAYPVARTYNIGLNFNF
ncbi:TonB-dependent receptor [Parabacteroides sp. OttesenSCG-928-N08]|nr:TonB-dependent receptor [Parabacteroides sp. OttesenSCG-928-N08]